MKLFISALAIISGLTTATQVAAEQQVCLPAAEMKASLIDWYGETPVAEPTAAKDQLWASKHTGTWTLVKTLSDGYACVVAQGDDWTLSSQDNDIVAQLGD